MDVGERVAGRPAVVSSTHRRRAGKIAIKAKQAIRFFEKGYAFFWAENNKLIAANLAWLKVNRQRSYRLFLPRSRPATKRV
jgi:hypothetical protein